MSPLALLSTLQGMFSFVLEYMKSVEISAVIDIAFIAFITYKLLRALRNDKTANRILIAILLLLLALGLSSESVFKLYATNYILRYIFQYGILALLVIFAPEMRRFLERMGSGTYKLGDIIHGQQDVTEIEACISETVAAFTSMSRTKCGALIVFERTNSLDEIIKTGTSLECKVSAELLKNIFWNKAPLHDGAVIVRNGIIVAAGCMLPLTSNRNISHELGMRHRAGIGMSESSDAVVAIVSEETGTISVAVDGMLKRHLAPETLERLLRTELINEPNAKSSDEAKRDKKFVHRRNGSAK